MKKLFACFLALTLSCTFIACNNNASGSSGTAESWSLVTVEQKNRLFGTWKHSGIAEGMTYTITVNVIDSLSVILSAKQFYSSIPQEQVAEAENAFEDAGLQIMCRPKNKKKYF